MDIPARDNVVTLPGSKRVAGCTDACIAIQALVPGAFGRREVRLHDPTVHEAHGAEKSERQTILITGPLEINRREGRVYVGGREVVLATLEWRVLELLASRAGQVIASPTILFRVWGTGYQDARTILTTTIWRLRRSLGEAGELVESTKNRGYRLVLASPEWHPRQPYAPVWAPRLGLMACRVCGSDERRHRAQGYCTRCSKAAERRAKAEVS